MDAQDTKGAAEAETGRLLLDSRSAQIAAAEKSLELKLAWVDRADKRSSIVLATNGGVFVIYSFALRAMAPDEANLLLLYVCPALIFASIFCIIYSYAPILSGARPSLIFFSGIAEMELEAFEAAFLKQTRQDYLRDLMGQIHVNSRILARKFRLIRISVNCQFAAIMTWVIGSVI